MIPLSELQGPTGVQLQNIVALVVNAVHSEHSKRAYASATLQFLEWWQHNGCRPLSRALVQEYRSCLERSLSPASVNLHLSAVRKLVAEAAEDGMLALEVASGIARVKGARAAGSRIGKWLSVQQSQDLLCSPDAGTNRGKRDRLILALLLGCGLRRTELAGLKFENIQQREGRWVVVDLIGKGNRVRSIPMPNWAEQIVNEWRGVLPTGTGPVLRRINKADKVSTHPMTAQAIYKIIKNYRSDIAPHDLRRSFSKLAHRGGAPIEQISLSLGHASVRTTERYLGIQQNLVDAPADHLGLRAPGEIARRHT